MHQAPIRRDRRAAVLASMTQERFWFVDQLRPGTSLHNLAFGMDISGPLDTDAVAWALSGIVRRHEVLRTRFTVHDGRLTQQFALPENADGMLVRHEVGDRDGLEALTAELAHRPFSYTSGPMLRVALISAPGAGHRLVLVAHHAIFDGWSLGIFLAEFAELYRARTEGRPAALEDLQVQYADYASWQRTAHDGGAFDADLAYWTRRLAGGCPPLRLPTDHPRPERPRLRGGTHRFTVPADLAGRVKRVAAEESATAYMAWLALFQVLLFRHTGQREFRVGSPVYNRPEKRFQGLLGPFVNVLVLGAELDGDPTFRELLARVRAGVTEALDHQQLPLQTLADKLAARPGTGRSPLFQVSLALQPFADTDADLADGLKVRSFPIDVDHAQHDLSLFLTPTPRGVDAMMQYDADLFRASSVAEFCDDLLTLARRLTRDTDLPIARLRSRTPAAPGPAARGEAFPTSRQQEHWWRAERDRPGDPAWKIATAVRGTFDATALRENLTRLTRRHEVLRSRLDLSHDEPRLVLADSGDRDADSRPGPGAPGSGGPVLRPRALGEGDDPAAVVEEILSAPVDLTADPPATVDLLTGGSGSTLLLATHRFAIDEESHRLLVRDLLAGCADDGGGVEFLDYALWQRRNVHGERADALAAHWRAALAGAPERPALPAPSPRVPDASTRATPLPVSLPAEPLERVCAEEDAPLEAAVIAALAVALGRYGCGQDLIVHAHAPDRIPVGGRQVAEVAGCFADLLPVRVRVDDRASFRELLRATAHSRAQAREHRDVPAGTRPPAGVRVRLDEGPPVAAPVSPAAGTSHAAGARRTVRAAEVTDVSDASRHTPFDLALDLRRTGDRLEGTVRHRTETVAAPLLAGVLTHLLTTLAEHPDRPVGQAPTLSPDEHRAIAGRLAAPDLPRADATLHARFEECAVRTPGAAALIHQGRRWSYGALDAWANRIAHGLVEAGLRAGRPVALLMPSGPLAVAALLGVLKAGGAFACLDPRSPAGRLTDTLAALGPDLVLADTAAEHGTLAAAAAHRLVVLAEDAARATAPHPVRDFAEQPSTRPAVAVDAGDAAYVAHTSGSTGAPKGIGHRHRDLAQFVAWQSGQFGIGPGSRVGQLASLTFDVAYCEIFGALCHGATLCLRPPAMATDPAVLGDWLHEERVTLLQTIPRLFREIVRALDAHGRTEEWLAGLRTVMFVGEALPVDLVEMLGRRFGKRLRLVNVYGPTEVVAATFHCVDGLPPGAATVPVGRPIPGRHLLLRDEAGRLCPPGVVGEIWIASRYLSDGYLGHQEDPDAREQTRLRFRPSPFAEADGTLYRTGDLAVLRPDGLLEYAGRTDNQVKLSGIRLELEEVEAAVVRHPRVRECAAAVRGDGDVQRLAAYVVADGPVDDLPAFLRTVVPAHMVPADVVPLPSLPRGANGKVDRSALPRPPAGTREADGGVPPRTPLERRLAELAGQVLGLDGVGVTDDLFEHGGNSLQAARFVNRIRETYGVDIPLQTLFENPTVAATAAATEHAQRQLGHTDRLARIERDLDQLSDDEVRALLALHRTARPTAADHELENPDSHGTVRDR